MSNEAKEEVPCDAGAGDKYMSILQEQTSVKIKNKHNWLTLNGNAFLFGLLDVFLR